MPKILAVLTVLFTFNSLKAEEQNWYYEKYWTGCCYNYRKVYYQTPVTEVKKETTIVNNLIGIPVPVQYTQPIAQQGTTVYGYSSVADTYGSLDMGLLYNQASRLTDQAQQLAGQAATDFHTLVQAEGQNRADVAKIIAQGQAAREALTAAKGFSNSVSQQRVFTFKVTQDSKGNMNIEKVDGGTTQNQTSVPDLNLGTSKVGSIAELLKSKCVSCHNNEKSSGGLNFLQAVSDQQQRSCLERITSSDLQKRMPLNGAKLNIDEIGLFFKSMSK